MNRFQYMGMMILSMLVLWGCSGITKAPAAQTMTLDEVRNSGDRLAEAMKTDGAIIHIPAGETVPLKIALEIPFAAAEPGENRLRFTKDVYLYVSKNKMMLSADGVSYAPIHKFKSIKRLFGASKGSFQVGFGAQKDKEPQVSVSLSMK